MKKKFMRSKWLMLIVGVLVGTMFGATIKPMLSKIPVIGPMLDKVGGKTPPPEEGEVTE